MKRSKLNIIFDVAAFAGFVFLTTTGVLMRYVLPPGSRRFVTIWGLDRHGWGSVHFWISIAFLALLAMHLFLHWRWITNSISGRQRNGSGLRAGLGIVGAVALLALAIAPLLSPVKSTLVSRSGRDLSSVQHDNVQVWGAMTLEEAEKATGVPVEHILRQLGLPSDIVEGECLGELKKMYQFTMDDVRQVIDEYKERQ